MQWTIEHAGDAALLVRFECAGIADSNGAVGSLTRHLNEQPPLWLVDLVPAYNTLLVCFDMFRTDHFAVMAALKAWLDVSLPKSTERTQRAQQRVWRLPCWYDAPQTPDLANVAQYTGHSKAQVIDIHQNSVLRVYAVGFAPGFAFLGELPQSVATPRLPTPRKRVPAGAVALANRQTAVYPNASPGGWNLIGLCPIVLFAPERPATDLMQVGDRVQFYSVDETQYTLLIGKPLDDPEVL